MYVVRLYPEQPLHSGPMPGAQQAPPRQSNPMHWSLLEQEVLGGPRHMPATNSYPRYPLQSVHCPVESHDQHSPHAPDDPAQQNPPMQDPDTHWSPERQVAPAGWAGTHSSVVSLTKYPHLHAAHMPCSPDKDVLPQSRHSGPTDSLQHVPPRQSPPMQDALEVQFDPGGPIHTPLMRALEEAQEVQVPASLLQPPQALSTVGAQHRPARHLLDAQSWEMATTTAKRRR